MWGHFSHTIEAVGEGNEILALDKKIKQTTELGDVAERLKLISLMKDTICLWANGKFSKPEKDAVVS